VIWFSWGVTGQRQGSCVSTELEDIIRQGNVSLSLFPSFRFAWEAAVPYRGFGKWVVGSLVAMVVGLWVRGFDGRRPCYVRVSA
jgi:hypothetical protein